MQWVNGISDFEFKSHIEDVLLVFLRGSDLSQQLLDKRIDFTLGNYYSSESAVKTLGQHSADLHRHMHNGQSLFLIELNTFPCEFYEVCRTAY